MAGPAPGGCMNSLPIDIHPVWFEEKSGGAAVCCANAGAFGAPHIKPARMLPVSTRSLILMMNEAMVAPPLSLYSRDQATPFPGVASSRRHGLRLRGLGVRLCLRLALRRRLRRRSLHCRG